MYVSRVLLCGGKSLARDAEMVKNELHVPFVMMVSPRPLDGIMASCPQSHRLLAHVLTTLNHLSAACKYNDMCAGGLLMAYDMPFMDGIAEEQPYLSKEMRGHEVNQLGVSACLDLLAGIYPAVAFDYVFRFPEAPPLLTLMENGVVESEVGVVNVFSWRDAAQVLLAEGM